MLQKHRKLFKAIDVILFIAGLLIAFFINIPLGITVIFLIDIAWGTSILYRRTKNKRMQVETVSLNGKNYRLFSLVLFPNSGREVPIIAAEQALDDEINKIIQADEYEKVQHIDERYEYWIPQKIADTQNANIIRTTLEKIYEY